MVFPHRAQCSGRGGHKQGVRGPAGHFGLALLHWRLVGDQAVREQGQLVSHPGVEDVPARGVARVKCLGNELRLYTLQTNCKPYQAGESVLDNPIFLDGGTLHLERQRLHLGRGGK